MSNRVFLSLALCLPLAVTLVHSYDPYGLYESRDETSRHVSRCPTCPADCPESLASPWYGSPTVYGRAPPFQVSNNNFEGLAHQQGSYAARPTPDSSSEYGNSYFEGSKPYEKSRCCCHKARSLRSEKASSDAYVEESRFDSTESRGPLPYGYHRTSSPASASLISENYRETENVGIIPTDNYRIGRHYGNAYKDETTEEEESLGANDSKWKSVSLPIQRPIGAYQSPERMSLYEGRLRAVETPSQKKVFVVYRADADETIDDNDLDRSLISGTTSRQQHNYHRNSDNTGSSYPMTDFQLEELVRRAIAVATRQNINRDPEQLYDRQQRGLGINYNEHERNPEESYDPRRPYNDDLYRRFNIEEKKLYAPDFGASEVVYTPTMRYNPYVLPENEYRDIPGNSRYNTAWEAQPISNVDEDIDEYTSQRGRTTILEELREISREEEKRNEQRDQKSFQRTQDDIPTNKRETDTETLLPPPINYRTHSRTTDTEQVREQKGKTSGPLEDNTQKDDQSPPVVINPDLTEDMEIPPIEDSEVQLQLSFESSDSTTPSPTN